MSLSVEGTAPPRRWSRNGVAVLALLAVVLGLTGARLFLRVQPGLAAEYFDNADLSSSPVVSAVDPQPSTEQVERRWPPIAPAQFRVRWFGYIGIDNADTYTFSITADDGAALSIDGTTILDTGAGRGIFTQSASVPLTTGLHAVLIDYRQSGGEFAFEWTWARGTGTAEPIPVWCLVPQRSAWGNQRVAWWIDRIRTLLATVLVIGWCVSNRSRIALAVRRRPVLSLLVLFIALAVAQTWPLASDPAHLSRNDNADTILNEWALSWVAHQALRDPWHLFDANIFYPERYTLAYSESMIVQSAMGAPMAWAGLSPVLVYNILLIAGFALSGWSMAFVIRRWTADSVAAITAGILFAFNAHSLTRLPHMQALHVEFLPLALLAWDRLLRFPRLRYGLLLGVTAALQALTSVYLTVFTLVGLSAAAVVRINEWTGTRFRAVAPQILVSATVAAAICVPFLLPYLWINQAQGLERSLEDAISLAATLGSYLASPSRLHYGLWSFRWFDSPSALFPGITATLLTGVAIFRGVAFRDPRARLGLALLVGGVVMSFGSRLPGYALLFSWVPIFRVVRVVARFGFLALTGIAIVAAFGMIEVRAFVPGRAWRFVAGTVLALMFIEPLAAPIELRRVGTIPRIYDLLRNDPRAVVVEVPFYTTAAGFQQAQYMLNSTRHWRPMLNGYSGFRPVSFYTTAEALQDFPSERSITWLRQKGVTHAFVNLGAYDESVPSRLDATPGVARVASDRGIALYDLGTSY